MKPEFIHTSREIRPLYLKIYSSDFLFSFPPDFLALKKGSKRNLKILARMSSTIYLNCFNNCNITTLILATELILKKLICYNIKTIRT